MEISKHRNHRNQKYLSWLRTQPCAISGKIAECAHHIRLGTNGGSGLKPSDYFCIPLTNDYHTTGPSALHIIGEETFLKNFNLNRNQLFVQYLKAYLKHEHKTVVEFDHTEDEVIIAFIINLIEEKRPESNGVPRKNGKKKKKTSTTPKQSLVENEYYQKTKEAKRAYDKELRQQLKSEKPSTAKATFKGNEYYEKAKAAKKVYDKEMREIFKPVTKKQKVKSSSESEYYQKAKEARKAMEKELREQVKERQSKYRKEMYKKSKELRR